MKNLISIVTVFGIMLLAIPLIALIDKNNVDNKILSNNQSNNIDTIKLLDISDNKVKELSLKEYMIGSVLSQIPASFEIETLKAQAVITHTYIVRRRIAEKEMQQKT